MDEPSEDSSPAQSPRMQEGGGEGRGRNAVIGISPLQPSTPEGPQLQEQLQQQDTDTNSPHYETFLVCAPSVVETSGKNISLTMTVAGSVDEDGAASGDSKHGVSVASVIKELEEETKEEEASVRKEEEVKEEEASVGKEEEREKENETSVRKEEDNEEGEKGNIKDRITQEDEGTYESLPYFAFPFLAEEDESGSNGKQKEVCDQFSSRTMRTTIRDHDERPSSYERDGAASPSEPVSRILILVLFICNMKINTFRMSTL